MIMFFASAFCFLIFNLWKLHRQCVEHKVLRVILESLGYVLSFFLLLNVWPTGTNTMPYSVVKAWPWYKTKTKLLDYSFTFWFFYISSECILHIDISNLLNEFAKKKKININEKSPDSWECNSSFPAFYGVVLLWKDSMHKWRVPEICTDFCASFLHIRSLVNDLSLSTKNFVTVFFHTGWWQDVFIQLHNLNVLTLKEHLLLSKAMIWPNRFCLIWPVMNGFCAVENFRYGITFFFEFLGLFYSISHKIHF